MTVVRKSPDAFRTISEVSEILDIPAHVLRFWESRFTQIKPVKRGGGRRYYRPQDIDLLRGIRDLLYDEGMTIKGVQKILRDRGVRHVAGLGHLAPEEDPILQDAIDEETPAEVAAPAAGRQAAHGREVAAEADPAAIEAPVDTPVDAPVEVGIEAPVEVAVAPAPREAQTAARKPQPAAPQRAFPHINLPAAGRAREETQVDLFAHAAAKERRPFPPDPARVKRAEQLRLLLGKLEALREKMARDLR